MLVTWLLVVAGVLMSPTGTARAEGPEPAETEVGTEAATRSVHWQVAGDGEPVADTAWTLTGAEGTVRSVVDNGAAGSGGRVADTDSADGAFTVADLPVGAYTVTAIRVGEGFVTPAPTTITVEEGAGTQELAAIALTAEEPTPDPAEGESDADTPAESAEPTAEAESEATRDESAEQATRGSDSATTEPRTKARARTQAKAPEKSEATTSAFGPKAVPNPQPAAQPSLPTTCGLDIAIVLDLSNSLTNSDVASSKTAAKGFVSALEGTPSSVGLYTFATFANPQNSLGITSVATAEGATTVRNKIDAVARVATSEGGTNWDKGFAQVPTGTYDLIVFVTDGNPTAYGTPGTGGNNDFGTGTEDIDVNEGIKSANVHKNAGTFVIGLGVGEVTAQNIRYISGNRQNTDYYLISDYDALSAALKEIALKNCEGTLTVVKQVRGLDGTLRPGQDWTFTSTTETVTPASGQTDENGAVNYDDNLSSGRNVQPVTITETQQDLYRLEQQSGQNAVCTNRSIGQAVSVTNSGELGFTVDVPRDGAISCTVINAQYEVYEDLTVTDDIRPQFDRDYDWSLVKDVDRNAAQVPAGTEASFDYSVVVTPTDAQDSNFGYRGVATVQNPNDTAISGVDVTVEAPGAECTPTRDVPSTIEANRKILVGYTCDFPDATAATAGTHTTTATWDAAAHHGTTGTAVEETDFDFADARVSTTDGVVTVTDDLLGMSETVAAVDGEQRFDYTLEFAAGAEGTCVDHTNTAALSSDDSETLSDSETVTVCAPEPDPTPSTPVPGTPVESGDPTPPAPTGGSDPATPATGAGTGPDSTVTGTGSNTTVTSGGLASTGATAGLLGLLAVGALAVLAGGWLVARRRFGQDGA